VTSEHDKIDILPVKPFVERHRRHAQRVAPPVVSNLDHAGAGFLQQVADGLQCVRGKRREFGVSLSQTQSD
jgi:hypothetical protein